MTVRVRRKAQYRGNAWARQGGHQTVEQVGADAFRAFIVRRGIREPLGDFPTHKEAKRAVAIELNRLRRAGEL